MIVRECVYVWCVVLCVFALCPLCLLRTIILCASLAVHICYIDMNLYMKTMEECPPWRRRGSREYVRNTTRQLSPDNKLKDKYTYCTSWKSLLN